MTTALARRADPESSHEAAASIRPVTSQDALLVFIDRASVEPFTHKQLEIAYTSTRSQYGLPALSPSRIRTACHELAVQGRLTHVGHIVIGTRRHRAWELTR